MKLDEMRTSRLLALYINPDALYAEVFPGASQLAPGTIRAGEFDDIRQAQEDIAAEIDRRFPLATTRPSKGG